MAATCSNTMGMGNFMPPMGTQHTGMTVGAVGQTVVQPQPTMMLNDTFLQFLADIKGQVLYGCAIPVNLSDMMILNILENCARYFWENYDGAVYETQFVIHKEAFRPTMYLGQKAQSLCLPHCIRTVFNCQRTKASGLIHLPIKDKDVRTAITSGMLGGNMTGGMRSGIAEGRRQLQDFVVGIYELDTWKQVFNETLTFDWNYAMRKLIILGDMKGDNVAAQGYLNVPIENLINLQLFRDYVLAKVRKAYAVANSVVEFTLPGGLSISFDKVEALADEDISKIEEKINNHNHGFILFPNEI